MTDKFDTDYLEVGDSFEGGPIEQSYFISAIMAAGGEVEVHGNKVLVIGLPKKESLKAKAPVSEKPVEKAPEPVEELSPAEDLAPVEEAVVEVKKETPKPVAKPALKPKAAPAPVKEED